MIVKTCLKCRIEQPITEYHTNKQGRDGKQPRCRTCLHQQQRDRRKLVGDNPTYRYRYGKTVTELNDIKEQQNNACAICKEAFTNSFNSVVDHCHTKNTFRGFLCRKCNSGLGMFRDNIEYLQNAIDYLKCHS